MTKTYDTFGSHGASTSRNPEEEDPLLGPRGAPSESEPVWRQYMATFLGSLISMGTGCAGGWTSAAVPLLLNGQATDLGGIGMVTVDEASWITSLMNLGSLVGSVPAGHLSFKWGRRKFLLSIAFLLIFGWLLILLNCNNVALIYLGRFICGVVAGCVCVALSMYSNEICCDVIRGRSGVFYDMMQVFGISYVYTVSAMFSLFWTTIWSILVPIVFLLTFSKMPESPVYLVSHGRTQEAVEVIKWLHGEHCDVEYHLERIHTALLEGKEHHNGDDECDSPFSGVKNFFSSLSPITIKSYFLVLLLFMVQRSCGAPVIVYYAQDVFLYASANMSTSLATVFLGIAQFLCSASSLVLIDLVGRRVLLTFSFSTMILSLCTFLWYLHLVDSGFDVESQFGWVPVAAICTFVGVFRLGVGPIPWFMCAELIPTEAQRWALPTIFFVAWSVAFFCSKTYLSAVTAIGYENVFVIFIVICVAGLLHTFFLIPETKNKSRAQIQEELGSGTTAKKRRISYSAFTPNPVVIIEN